MSTVLYRNAIMLINGVALSGQIHDLAVDLSAEILDQTTMGADTRIKKGGLFVGKISGKGYFDGSVNGIEAVLFADTGPDDEIFIVFPDGVTEGSLTSGTGFAMKGVLSTFQIGGNVGQLLDISFAAESRGLGTPGVTNTP